MDQPLGSDGPTSDQLAYRGHIKALDGIRGVAILAVLVAHFYPEAAWKEHYPVVGPILNKLAQVGLTGVELFFVLSGFLITGILLSTKGLTAGQYFGKFYARRILRIFPLYYGVLFAVFLILPRFVPLDTAAQSLSSHHWKLWLYLINWPIDHPNWDSSHLYWLGHFWSLSVEEHFYLVWPLVVYSCSPKALVRVCAALILMGNVARLSNILFGNASLWLFQWSTLSKVDALALGALLAILVRESGWPLRLIRWAKPGVLVFGMSFFCLSFVPRRIIHSSSLLQIIQSPTIVLFFGSLLILAIQTKPGSMVSRTMRSPILIWFGQYSYGLYIIHGLLRPALLQWFPLDRYVSFVRLPFLGLLLQMASCFAVCMLLAYLSWHWYEKRFLSMKRYFE